MFYSFYKYTTHALKSAYKSRCSSSKMLLSMTKVGETNGYLHAFEYRKIKKGMWSK